MKTDNYRLGIVGKRVCVCDMLLTCSTPSSRKGKKKKILFPFGQIDHYFTNYAIM